MPLDGQSFISGPHGVPNVPTNYNSPGPQEYGVNNSFPMTPNLGVLGQPVVQDMAMQYGQQVNLKARRKSNETAQQTN